MANSPGYRKLAKPAHGADSAAWRAIRWALVSAAAALLIVGFGSRLGSRWSTNLGAITLLEASQDSSRSLDRAVDALQRAIDLDGKNGSAWRLLGQARYRQGDYAAARDALAPATQTSEPDVLALYWHGMVNLADARYQEAGEDWLKAGFLDYKLQLLRDQAHDLAGQGDQAAAEAVLLTAIQLLPTDPGGYYLLAGLYWGQLERQAEASDAFRAGLALDPSDSFQRFWAEGRLYLLMKQWPLAVAALEKAARANTDHKEARTHLGYACWQDGQVERATTVLTSVVEQWPDYFEPYLYLSTMAGERGKAESSVRYLLDYLTLRPDHARACDQLVQILSARQDRQLIDWTWAELARVAPASVSCSAAVSRLVSSP